MFRNSLGVMALLVFSHGAAQAGRPLVTDDAGVLERRQCELEGGLTRERADELRSRSESLQLGCGVGGDTQLALATSHARTGGDQRRERMRGVALLVKTRLWQQDDAALSLSASLDGLRAAGKGWRLDSSRVNLIHSRPGPAAMTWHINLGHARNEHERQASTTWGVALEHPGLGAVAPMAELFGDDRSAPWWNLGLRWTLLADRAWLDTSYGRQIVGSRPTAWTMGFKLVF